MDSIIASLVFVILAIIVINWGIVSYHEDADSAAILGFVILIFSIIGLGNSVHEYNKSDTAKKYDKYVELKREKEQDSINRLHYKWNKDLDNKIKKLKYD